VYGGELSFTNIKEVCSTSFSVNTWPGGERFIFTFLKMCVVDRRKIQDIITPYVPYILRVLLFEIVEECKENKA